MSADLSPDLCQELLGSLQQSGLEEKKLEHSIAQMSKSHEMNNQ